MRALVQRVSEARVEVDDRVVGRIGAGWLILLGVRKGDNLETAKWLAEKCIHLRGFADDQGKMNRSIVDVQGQLLIVSQFTLYGDCQRGRRPGFDDAAPPDQAKELYLSFCEHARSFGISVEQGVFQADMKVSLVNDGPVTFLVER